MLVLMVPGSALRFQVEAEFQLPLISLKIEESVNELCAVKPDDSPDAVSSSVELSASTGTSQPV